MTPISTLRDVVDWRLCLGCGACAYICPDRRVQLFDFSAEGIRPVIQTGDCGECRDCLDVCPAVQSDFRVSKGDAGPAQATPRPAGPNGSTNGELPRLEPGFVKEWGAITGLWEGHAADPEVRFQGSSGGAITAIGAYCLEMLGMYGVLHIAQDPEDPVRNRTRLSRTRDELRAATGSRYSPASVCNGLGLVEGAPGPCAIIGKPAEIAAARNAARLRSALSEKVGVTLSFFCAETPSTHGTVSLLRRLGIDPAAVRDLRYRGFGWPGHFAPTVEVNHQRVCNQRLTYRESWAYLQAFRPWSTQFWPDGSGELADISFGDPWYEQPDGENPGFSLVVARTRRGREIVEGAMAAGYLVLKEAETWKLAKSQPGLLTKKGAIWGRRATVRLLGLPVARLEGLDLRHCWNTLTLKEKLRATFGTFRRVLSRKLYRRLQLDTESAVAVKAPVTTTQAEAGAVRSPSPSASHR